MKTTAWVSIALAVVLSSVAASGCSGGGGGGDDDDDGTTATPSPTAPPPGSDFVVLSGTSGYGLAATWFTCGSNDLTGYNGIGFLVETAAGCPGTQFVEFVAPALVDLSGFANGAVTFKVRVSNSQSLSFAVQDGLGRSSPLLNIGNYGYSSVTTGIFQPISIPVSTLASSDVDLASMQQVFHLSIGCGSSQCVTEIANIVWRESPLPGTATANRAYVTNGSSSVHVIDTVTNELVATIPVGSVPIGVAVDPASDRLWVENINSSTVSVIDTGTNTVAATVGVGSLFSKTYSQLSFSAAAKRVYVANRNNNTVSVIDAVTDAVIATVAVGSQPAATAVDPPTSSVYVTNENGNTVSVIDIDSHTVLGPITVGTGPSGIAIDSTAGKAYVANSGSANVSVIDTGTNTVIATIPVGTTPRGVAADALSSRVYVTNSASNTLSIIDTATDTVIDTITVGSSPMGVAVGTPDRVYVANQGNGSVSIVDANGATLSTGIPAGAYGITVAP